jgi:hypothetical protein
MANIYGLIDYWDVEWPQTFPIDRLHVNGHVLLA